MIQGDELTGTVLLTHCAQGVNGDGSTDSLCSMNQVKRPLDSDVSAHSSQNAQISGVIRGLDLSFEVQEMPEGLEDTPVSE